LPTTPRDQLGSRLRQLRARAGLSGDALAKRAGLSQSKISRVETGRSLPSVEEVKAWAAATNATSEELTELATLVEQVATTATSWRVLQRLGLVERQREIAELERQAKRILTFQPVVIPGLLQVPDYAKRVMAMGYAGEADPQAVAARLERQRILYDETKQFEFLISEGALRWRPGDMNMRPQMDRLVSAAGLPNVTLGIVPFDQASTVFMNQFVLWELPDETLVTVETYSAELHVREAPDLERYRRVLDELRRTAMTGREAVRLLSAISAGQRPSLEGG
jgi:transcriptional regulator with XRE-family HTH domain